MKKLNYFQVHKNKAKRKRLFQRISVKHTQLAFKQNKDGTLSGFDNAKGQSIILVF